MISYLRGKCIEKSPTHLILDVHGVGYDVAITLNCYQSIEKNADEVAIYTYLSVSENAMLLYGFANMQEREMFLLLISISGIGPKLGQVILSGIPVQELKQAILANDGDRLKSISGIGKKTAERILIELRDKIAKTGDVSTQQKTEALRGGLASNEAVLALISLGYKKPQAEIAVQKLLKIDPMLSVEEIIKQSLRSF
jgi:Holliday junction DNA helicase RuvA